jgi:hypothetical protein
MKRIYATATASAAAIVVWLAAAGQAAAQQLPAAEKESASTADDYQYLKPIPPKVEAPSLAQQKARARGEQRMARLEALRWYGFSNSRPVATAMPWTTMYSPAWQMPGGRPYAWFASQRPVFIYVTPEVMYR